MTYLKCLIILFSILFSTACHGSSTHVNKQHIPGEKNSATTIQVLIDSLESKNSGTQRNAIKQLRLLGGEGTIAIPRLLEIIAPESKYSSKVQMEAMLAVANIAPSNKEVANTLLLKLGDQDEEIRKKALEAIYKTRPKDPATINIIEQMSIEDQSRMVRKTAQKYYRSLKTHALTERKK